DAEILLLLDRYRQLEVHHSNVRGHIASVGRGKVTLGPGALEWLGGQMEALVISQRRIILERLETSIELAMKNSMFTFLVQVHFVSSFANKATLLVETLKLAMFVVLIIVSSQGRMRLES